MNNLETATIMTTLSHRLLKTVICDNQAIHQNSIGKRSPTNWIFHIQIDGKRMVIFIFLV